MPDPPIYVGGTAGEVLRAARVDSRLTQRQLAERAGITQPVVAAYETGRRQPTIPMLRRLLAAADHNLAVTAVPKTVTSDERTHASHRWRRLATERSQYRHAPDDYWSLLVSARDLERLRARGHLPPLPRHDDPSALRARARRLGLLDAQA